MATEKNIAISNGDLAVQIGRMDERINAMAEDVHEMKNAIVGGNGHPGLVERTAILEHKSLADAVKIVKLEDRMLVVEASSSESKGSGLAMKPLIAIIVSLASTVGLVVKALVDYMY